MIHWTTGDIFAESYDVLVNPVNCVGVMGAGLAKSFRERFPRMFTDYQRTCEEGLVPGALHIWSSTTICIVNFPTKHHWRDASRLEWILSGLKLLKFYLQKLAPLRVALPALGCGLGGLPWCSVKSLMQQELHDLRHDIFIFEPIEVQSDN